MKCLNSLGFEGVGLLDFEDSLSGSNIDFLTCINSLGFGGVGLLTSEDSLSGSIEIVVPSKCWPLLERLHHFGCGAILNKLKLKESNHSLRKSMTFFMKHETWKKQQVFDGFGASRAPAFWGLLRRQHTQFLKMYKFLRFWGGRSPDFWGLLRRQHHRFCSEDKFCCNS